MKNPLSGELLVVAWCILGGCLSGIWYDFFKAIRKNGTNSNIAVAVQDILFWLGETAVIYSVLFLANNGVIRWYEIFFILFGFALYRWLLSELVLFLLLKLFVLIRSVLKILFLPLKSIGKFMKRNKKTRIARFIRRILKKQQ